MADIDLTITDAQYTQFSNLISGLQVKLDPLRVPLARILSQENGRDKIVQWVKNHPNQARLLVLTNQLANYLEQWHIDIGWRDD